MFFGDGAGAILLTATEEDRGFLQFELHSDGAGKDGFTVPAGGCEIPTTAETMAQGLHNFQMDGKAVFETACTLGQVSELVGRSLTVHSGADASSSTIAMAVCGLANPASCFYDSDKSGIRCGSAQPPVDANPGKTKVGGASSARAIGRAAAAAAVVAAGVFGML